MPFQCSSQRLTKRAGGLRLSPSSFLPPSRMALRVRLPVIRPSILVSAADVLADRHAVVVEDHQQVRFRSSMPPAWPSASKAMPAVIAPSPITATTLRSIAGARIGDRHAQRGRDRGRGMADAEGVVFAFLALGERRHAVLLLDRVDAVAAAGEDLVRIALVADVPDQAVVRGVVQVVQGDGQLDHAQPGAEVAAGAADRFDQVARAARRRPRGCRFPAAGAGRRGCRCSTTGDSGTHRSSAYCRAAAGCGQREGRRRNARGPWLRAPAVHRPAWPQPQLPQQVVPSACSGASVAG